jgi:transposase
MFVKRYHPSDIQKALHVYKIHNSLREASKIVNISKSTIHRWSKRFPNGMIDRKRNVAKKPTIQNKTRSLMEILRSILSNMKTRRVTLKYFQKTLETMHGKQISISSLSRLFSKMMLKRKRMRDRRIYCSQEKIRIQSQRFASEVQSLAMENIISVDESGFTTHGDHGSCYGYFFKNEIPTSTKYNFRWQKCSLAMAVCTNGVVCHNTQPCAFNKQSFISFFTEVMLNKKPCQKYIIMDNIQFHHSKEIKALARAYDTTIIYTPPYSPQFNPIEHAFSAIKRKFREYIDDGIEFKTAVSKSICDNYNKEFGPTFIHCLVHEPSKIV